MNNPMVEFSETQKNPNQDPFPELAMMKPSRVDPLAEAIKRNPKRTEEKPKTEAPTEKKRGRPKGSKNKTKEPQTSTPKKSISEPQVTVSSISDTNPLPEGPEEAYAVKPQVKAMTSTERNDPNRELNTVMERFEKGIGLAYFRTACYNCQFVNYGSFNIDQRLWIEKRMRQLLSDAVFVDNELRKVNATRNNLGVKRKMNTISIAAGFRAWMEMDPFLGEKHA